jgi:ribosomal protein S18 acetylase RimI-like enzyme
MSTPLNFQIKPLTNIPFDQLFACNLKAFKDYPFQWSKEAMHKTIIRRGFDASLSFGAYHEGELVSFTWNGIGMFNGLKTAYDTGTGTVEEHRGKGLASQIFQHSIPYLKAAGVQQYILEVLEENEKAISVYSKQGFTVSRTFDCFRTNSNEWNWQYENLPENIELKQINFSYQPEMEAMFGFNISWQNNFQSLLKNPDDFIILGAFKEGKLLGYGIIEPASGDIPLLAVASMERRKGIGSFIASELRKLNKADIVKMVNIPSNQEAIKQFIAKIGIPKIVSQYEMLKNI